MQGIVALMIVKKETKNGANHVDFRIFNEDIGIVHY
jgi:hypothetical protein